MMLLRKFGVPLLFILSVALPLPGTRSVLAGTNGQQIYFRCSSGIQHVSVMDYVIIRGKNQSGNDAEWRGYPAWQDSNQWSQHVFAAGYWWVGQVRVYWWNQRTNTWASGTYSIPQVQSGDVVNLSC